MSHAGRLDRLARLLDGTRAVSVLARRPWGHGIVVLNYHRIGDASSSPLDRDLFSATPRGFDAQLAWLAKNADVIDPADLEAQLRSRRPRRVMITFDDGYRDNHEHALPALRRHGLKAAFFVATGFVDRPRLPWWDAIAAGVRERGGDQHRIDEVIARYKASSERDAEHLLDRFGAREQGGEGLWMTWDMIRELSASGMTIGGHSVDHPVLARLSAADQEAEVAGCLDRIEVETGRRPVHFSYPVGLRDSFDDDTRAALTHQGVRWAYSFFGGVADPARLDPLAVPRTSVHHAMGSARFRALAVLPRLYARW